MSLSNYWNDLYTEKERIRNGVLIGTIAFLIMVLSLSAPFIYYYIKLELTMDISQALDMATVGVFLLGGVLWLVCPEMFSGGGR